MRVSFSAFLLHSDWLPAFANLKANDEPLTERIVSAVKPFIENGDLAGAVMLVADEEKVLARESLGFADIEKKKSD